MTTPQIVFMNKATGNIKICRTELEGELLGKEWTRIEFMKNANGDRVMRFKFDQFTIDVLPNGEQEVVGDGDTGTK